MKFTFMNLFRKETGAKPAPAPTDNADKRSIKVSILACLKGEPRDAPPQAPGQKEEDLCGPDPPMKATKIEEEPPAEGELKAIALGPQPVE